MKQIFLVMAILQFVLLAVLEISIRSGVFKKTPIITFLEVTTVVLGSLNIGMYMGIVF